ncbi:DUF2240 family protein [Candidatus Woesearchaeota archaeon]|jgi:replication factor A1|nr:DUF2240 family protein [Candidatus Woesearchaeota archaeon]MBT4367809.1 DUF2240 family protein [Candidatus Woesearchaeota archaeon]MBT4712297.1 DUF2240 family protein [Candidatus Woesearchaeota archaeon]MBT6638845.1 DUF2240 family protein [Candidatus Woesearchaeota archaeon]MBT7134489.1 DUF2240 family protein [Candidatus Woesearchaeota archaeon]
MIKIPYEQVLDKIKSNSELGTEDIEAKIKQKMDQLSGLISKEGAAHIIANELGVQLYDQFSGRLQIKNILPGLRDVEVLGKITQKYEVKEFKVGERAGKMGSFVIGDETGTIRAVMWGDIAEKLNELKKDDVVKITAAYSRENNGYKELHMNERSELEINPDGETVEVKIVEEKQERKKINELKQGDNVEVLGTIVDMFDPKFFEMCSECNKRAKNEGKCELHPESPITYSYVLNAFLDDGTDNIRIVMFKEQVEAFLSQNNEGMLKIKENPESFSEMKQNLLGSIVKLGGKAVNNQMFDRLEFIANKVDLTPDPKEEIKKMEENAI